MVREYDTSFLETMPSEVFIIVPVDPGRCGDAKADIRPPSSPISPHRPMADTDDVDIVMTINLTMATFIIITVIIMGVRTRGPA
jgi:hypothetical protein